MSIIDDISPILSLVELFYPPSVPIIEGVKRVEPIAEAIIPVIENGQKTISDAKQLAASVGSLLHAHIAAGNTSSTAAANVTKALTALQTMSPAEQMSWADRVSAAGG